MGKHCMVMYSIPSIAKSRAGKVERYFMKGRFVQGGLIYLDRPTTNARNRHKMSQSLKDTISDQWPFDNQYFVRPVC